MKLFHAIEGIMLKLGELPGLGFLAAFVSEHQQEKMRREAKFLKYKSYVQSLRGAADQAKHLGGGKGHHEEAQESSSRTIKKGSRAKEQPVEDDFEDFDEDYVEEDDDFESYLL